ncbi:MAG: 4-hydroxybutyrate--acetyl-CoA CoA transferase, partial [Proteobacteria bacterium]|nr:4-hydroxybutyrate--acetyl-CoA CoA transferase [Pseudomonadota bacterium]
MQKFDQEMQAKLVSIDDALKLIKNGDTIVTAMAAAEPQMFFNHIHVQAIELSRINIVCANPSRVYPCFDPAIMSGHLHFEALFLTAAVRNLQGSDFFHYVPLHLSQWTSNLLQRKKINIFWGSCCPPDDCGIVSLGPGAVYESEVFHSADLVILEVNPNIPLTYGSTLVRVQDVDFFVQSESQLPSIQPAKPSAIDLEIARFVGDLIKDGSTIQLGIGGIPNAVAIELRHKKDLGIHTEMINDAMRELYLAGVITGSKKSIWPHRIVGAFAYGSTELYNFIHNNPLVELHPASVVNDPYRIGRNTLMTSINTAVEVD